MQFEKDIREVPTRYNKLAPVFVVRCAVDLLSSNGLIFEFQQWNARVCSEECVLSLGNLIDLR